MNIAFLLVLEVDQSLSNSSALYLGDFTSLVISFNEITLSGRGVNIVHHVADTCGIKEMFRY